MPSEIAYRIMKLVLQPAVLSLVKEIEGIENVPGPPFVIAANHISYMDPVIVKAVFSARFGWKVFYLAKKEMFQNPFKRFFFENIGTIPVDRNGKGDAAIESAARKIKEKDLIGIFPEGTRSLDGKLHRGRTGAVRIALKVKCPILPVGILNTLELWPRGRKLPRFRKIAVLRIGNPIRLDEYYRKRITKKLLREITDEVMLEISGLTGQEYVG